MTGYEPGVTPLLPAGLASRLRLDRIEDRDVAPAVQQGGGERLQPEQRPAQGLRRERGPQEYFHRG